ncbi:MAG: hypothetical protein ABSD71_11475 [Bacteroidales bacterium]|jgi:hypothetical protein
MKALLVLIIFPLLISFDSFCQQKNVITQEELIGIWQVNSDEIASGWLDSYRFFGNKEFIFSPNQNDGLRRIISIKGTYRIANNKLYLKVISTDELEGGHFERSHITTLSDTWEIAGGVIKNLIQPTREEEVVEMKRCNNETSKKTCILFDGRKYYKLENDPLNY